MCMGIETQEGMEIYILNTIPTMDQVWGWETGPIGQIGIAAGGRLVKSCKPAW